MPEVYRVQEDAISNGRLLSIEAFINGGKIEIEDLEVIALEWQKALGVDGLLGMNWLDAFRRVCLDFENNILELHM